MKKITMLIMAAIISVTLTGCGGPPNNEDVGTVSGAVIGGLLGSQFGGGAGRLVATGVGAIAGAYIGGNIGRTMDKVDRMRMERALENAPTGRVVAWTNPDNGNCYRVVTTRTYYEQRQPCREYTTTAIIGGKKQQIYGTACRQADGSWRVVR